MKNQNNGSGSDYNREYTYDVPNDRANTTEELHTIGSSEQSAIEEESYDPVIRATIDKFNNEIANEENHQC